MSSKSSKKDIDISKMSRQFEHILTAERTIEDQKESKKDNEALPLQQGIVLAPSHDQGLDYAHAQHHQTLLTVTQTVTSSQANKVENANMKSGKCQAE